MRRPSRIVLIGCGLAVLIGLCGGVVLAVGGFGVIAAIFGPDPEGLVVDVVVEPAVVPPGESFQIQVTASNVGTQSLEITEITLPQSLAVGALLTGVNPPDSGRLNIGDTTSYEFALALPPGESARVTFTYQALSAGDYRGDLDVVVGPRRKITPLRVVVALPEEVEQPAPTATPAAVSRVPYEAVVQIIALYEEDGRLQDGWTGSGSIIAPQGLILTNAHVVLPDKYYPVDALIVALTRRADQVPERAFFAEVVQADPSLDIAVIRVVADLEGNDIDAQALNLPSVPLGDSDQLRLGDSLVILGYPGIGGETITLTAGEVGGFTAESGRGERAFIKTSATIAGGNSGGLATNDRGELIGVPTQLGYGGEDQFVDCRVLADTNRDGVVDDQDSCVPTGGFINALRPVNLAMPLIEAAKRGEVFIHPSPVDEVEMPQEGRILFQDDFSDPDSGWDIGGEAEYTVGYQEGEYHIEVRADNYLVWATPGETFGDVVVTIDLRTVAATGEGDYGVLCRYQDGDNHYALEVSEDGYASIWKMQAGEFVSLADWEFNDSIPQDGSAFSLSVACIGDRLMLAVDGVQLLEAQDGSFARGDIGLISGTWDKSGLVVAFDNLTAREP